MALNPRRTALLVCDMQERFRGAIHGFDAVAATIARMVKAAAILEMRVITTEQNPRALGPTVAELGLAQLPEHLNLGVFPKTKFSMLTPEVANKLGGRYAKHFGSASDHGEAIDNLIIVGIESHVCVTQTALDGTRAGGRPIIIADGVSSCNAHEVPLALARLRDNGCDVGTSESVLFQLMGDAAHPRFKEFSKLIKVEKEPTQRSLDVLCPNPLAKL